MTADETSKKAVKLVGLLALAAVAILQLSKDSSSTASLSVHERAIDRALNPPSLREAEAEVVPTKTSLEWATARRNLQEEHPSKDEKMPNILYILADDLGYNELGGGFRGIPTPAIDSIANNGVRFTQAYAASATCSPSRAAVFTGKFPSQIGWEFTPFPKQASVSLATNPQFVQSLPIPYLFHPEKLNQVPDYATVGINRTIPHMARIIKDKFGYKNYYFGKWDSGLNPMFSPRKFGWDESLCFQTGGALYGRLNDPNIVNGAGNTFTRVASSLLNFTVSYNDGPSFMPDEYMTDYLSTQTAKLVRELEHSTDPWHISLDFNAIHFPYQAKLEDFNNPLVANITNRIERILGAMLISLDRGVGRVLQALEETNQLENTIVIFTSDNGGPDYEEMPTRNFPFRGWKSTFFEGGIRVPYYLQWPKKIARGVVVDAPVMQLDLLPSALSLPTLVKKTFNANNIVQLRNSEQEAKEGLGLVGDSIWSKIFIQTNQNQGDVRHYDFEDRVMFWRSGHYHALRYRGFKMMVSAIPDVLYFFHIAQDPTEKNNLAATLGIKSQAELASLIADANAGGSLARDRFVGENFQLYESIATFYQTLLQTDAAQVSPDFPSLIETPHCIDRVSSRCSRNETFVFYPN